MNSNVSIIPSVNLISGGYTSRLVDNLPARCRKSDVLMEIHDVLESLIECGKIEAGYKFLQILYTTAKLEMPKDIAQLVNVEENCSSYLMQVITDIEDMV